MPELGQLAWRPAVAGPRPDRLHELFAGGDARLAVDVAEVVLDRLDRHGARDWMEWEDATPEALAAAIERLVDTTPAYEPVPHDGAARGAELIAELVGRR